MPTTFLLMEPNGYYQTVVKPRDERKVEIAIFSRVHKLPSQRAGGAGEDGRVSDPDDDLEEFQTTDKARPKQRCHVAGG